MITLHQHAYSHASFVPLQLDVIQQQFRDALRTSEKIQQASHNALLERFHDLEHGITGGPTHAEGLAASLKELLLDDDSEDHKLLSQVREIPFLHNDLCPSYASFTVLKSHQQESRA